MKDEILYLLVQQELNRREIICACNTQTCNLRVALTCVLNVPHVSTVIIGGGVRKVASGYKTRLKPKKGSRNNI